MTHQLYYEDIVVDSEITPLVKHPTNRQLVMWAGVSGDYYEIHYDKDFAQSKGLPGIIVHGQLAYSFLGQLMTDWVGEQGNLRKLTCSYKGMNFPGEPLVCKGKVSRKYIEDGEHYVSCNIWAENGRGEKTITGTAIVILARKQQ
jgi:acyl dehydratase